MDVTIITMVYTSYAVIAIAIAFPKELGIIAWSTWHAVLLETAFNY